MQCIKRCIHIPLPSFKQTLFKLFFAKFDCNDCKFQFKCQWYIFLNGKCWLIWPITHVSYQKVLRFDHICLHIVQFVFLIVPRVKIYLITLLTVYLITVLTNQILISVINQYRNKDHALKWLLHGFLERANKFKTNDNAYMCRLWLHICKAPLKKRIHSYNSC